MTAGVTAAMAAWYVEHFQSSMKTGRRNFAMNFDAWLQLQSC